ncbi:Cucumisin [Bertholletia excelsa]
MGDLPGDESSVASLHISMLQKVVGSEAENRLLHSYSKSFNGFSAKLTEEEVEELSDMDGVVSAFQSQKRKLHTTRSWDYMNFPLQVKRSKLESDVIVGVIDSGIWPESDSFSDRGFGPPPSKWKGICQSSSNFTCNKKIIGARYYSKERPIPKTDIPSPRDSDGHGTHCASTAAGNIVSKASLFGFGLGTARGGVPSARIAVYKTLWSYGSSDTDILAAFDDAIADGVDIISISQGGNYAEDYFSNSIAVGSFHAMKKGILTSAAAGNGGPQRQTISNVAPWLVSVASGTTDRKFLTPVKLGNREVYTGFSINTFELNHTYPLIYGGDAPNKIKGFKKSISRFCANNSLDKTLTKGKIILCDFTEETSIDTIHSSGVVGYVLRYQGSNETASSFPIPAAMMQPGQSVHMLDYIKSTRYPTGVIMRSIEGKEPLAPIVAGTSSRGPNPISPSVLKPDITAREWTY